MAAPSWRGEIQIMKTNLAHIAAIPLWFALACSVLGVVIAFVSDLLVQWVL
jgi:hypothetical protein